MQNTAITIGIVMLVLGFLASILGQFPVQGSAPATPVTVSSSITPSTFNKEAADEVGTKLNSAYTSVIDDLLTYIDSPDLARAEARRDSMVQYAKVLIPSFNDLSNKLQGNLDEMQADISETGEATP